ncbi:MAG TPA: ABC transporter permease [Nocardioides sp.]
MRAFAMLVLGEARMVVRDTAGLVVPLGLPLLILLTSTGDAAETEVAPGRSALDVIVLPIVVTTVVAMVGVINLPSFLALYRRTGILRRLAVTPVSPLMVLGAQAVVGVVQVLLGTGLALTVAVVALDARLPADALAALGVLLLAVATLFSVGLLVASIARTPNAAVALGLVLFLGLGAAGGMFGGSDQLPGPVGVVGAALPYGAAREALGAVAAGGAVPTTPLLALAAAVVAGTAVAAATFRWDR